MFIALKNDKDVYSIYSDVQYDLFNRIALEVNSSKGKPYVNESKYFYFQSKKDRQKFLIQKLVYKKKLGYRVSYLVDVDTDLLKYLEK